MKDKLEITKQWLGTGAINIFGIQFSGKDSLGIPLAEALGGKFLSSGDLVRAAAISNEDEKIHQAAKDSEAGILTPTEEFRRLIVPHLKDDQLAGIPLILGSVGRWIGEEEVVMSALIEGNHKLKAVIVIEMSEDEVWRRWNRVQASRNGGRIDDQDREKVQLRLNEFREKTLPVIEKYRELGYVITIDGSGSIDDSYAQAVDKLVEFALAHQ